MQIREAWDRFRTEDGTIKIDEKRKADTMLVLRKSIAEKQTGIISSRKRIIVNQFRYMDKSMIFAHVLLCAALLLVAAVMKWRGAEADDIVLFSILMSGVLGIASVVGISRIFFQGIAELGESCYFNVRQIVALYMLVSGVINLTVLSFGILFVGLQWKISLLRIGLYIMVPFVAAQGCCLKVLLTEAGRKNTYLLLMTGIFLVIFFIIMASVPNVYMVTAYAAWAAAFIAGVLLLGVQIRALFRGIEKGEIICMN